MIKNELRPKEEKMIYISHAFGNKPENASKVEEIMIILHGLFPQYIFISPIHNYGMLYDKTSYTEGLNMCLKLLSRCDECWVCGKEYSTGVAAEVAYCQNHKIPYKVLGQFKEVLVRKVCWKDSCDIDCLHCEFEDEDDEFIACWLRNAKLKGDKII